MTAEPFTEYLWFDLYRVALAAFALWMAVLVLRLGWHRFLDLRAGRRDERTHPFVYLSYALALGAIAGFRIGGLGTSPEVRLWVASAIVLFGFLGLTRRLRFSLRPPHRR